MKINVKKIFNWDVASVHGPVPVFSPINNGQGNGLAARMIGYAVIVDYKYHGKRHFFFDVNSERSWSVYGGPKVEAESFYRDMVLKQIKQIKNRRAANGLVQNQR